NNFYSLSPKAVATSLVLKENKNAPLNKTTRNGFGSGIYGRYYDGKIDNLGKLITCSYPYYIYEKIHGEVLTIASINTNRYLDKIIASIDNVDNINKLDNFLTFNNFGHLLTLWKLVFVFSGDDIDYQTLYNIFKNYVNDYIINASIMDSNGKEVNVLPINYIMKHYGYDGIIPLDN